MAELMRYAELVEGGKTIKQGEIFELAFHLFGSDNVITVPTVGQVIGIKIANKSGVVYETTGVVDGNKIKFTVSENIGSGEMRLEIKITEGTTLIQKYPAEGWIVLNITVSLDDVGVGNVYAVTAQQMRDEIAAIDTKADTAISTADGADAKSTTTQQQLDNIVIASGTSDAETIQARGGEPLLYNRLNKVDLKLVDTSKQLNWIGVIPDVKTSLEDATHNNILAINNAIDSIKNVGGTIYIPNRGGEYLIDTANFTNNKGIILYPNIKIVSNGATLKLKNTAYTNHLALFSTVNYVNGAYDSNIPVAENIGIDGLIIDGNVDNLANTYGVTGFNMYKVKNLSIKNVTIKNLSGTTGACYGIIAWYSDIVKIKDVIIDRTDRQNICIWETTNSVIEGCNLNFSHFRDNILVSTNTPVTYQKTHCIIKDTKCKNTSATGTHVIRFSGEGSGVVENCNLESNNNLHGVFVVDVLYKNVTIRGNRIKNCSHGVLVESTTDKLIMVLENEIENCTHGVRVNAGGGIIKIKDNKIKGSTNRPIHSDFADYVDIENNEVDGGLEVFLKVGKLGNLSNNKVNGMTGTYPINVSGDNTQFVNCNFNQVQNSVGTVIRIYTAGKAIGNNMVVSSTTLSQNQFNG